MMLKDLLLQNRSYRSFDESRKITREELLGLVELTRLTNASVNLQPLKYRLCTEQADLDAVAPYVRYAGKLKHMTFPPAGHAPTGYIVICNDGRIAKEPIQKDVGICALAIMLGAAEIGLGGCMIGSFDGENIRKSLTLPDDLAPVLVLALGKPDEKIVLEDCPAGGDVSYYRDENNLHHVPKRTLEEIVL